MSPTTDFFGRVAEQSIDPLEPWQWVLCVIGTLAMLVLSAFMGAILSDNFRVFSWLAGLFLTVFLYPCLLLMYRAIPPGTNLYWWLLTGSVMVISAVLFFVFHRLGKTPNPLHSFGVPIAALGVSTVLDFASERLAAIPLAWSSAVIGLVLVLVIGFAWASEQNR